MLSPNLSGEGSWSSPPLREHLCGYLSEAERTSFSGCTSSSNSNHSLKDNWGKKQFRDHSQTQSSTDWEMLNWRHEAKEVPEQFPLQKNLIEDLLKPTKLVTWKQACRASQWHTSTALWSSESDHFVDSTQWEGKAFSLLFLIIFLLYIASNLVVLPVNKTQNLHFQFSISAFSSASKPTNSTERVADHKQRHPAVIQLLGCHAGICSFYQQ